MIDRGKQNLLGVLIDAVDYEAAVDRVIVAAREGVRCTASALAVHGVMTGVLDPEHKYRLNRLDLVVPDGQPVRWALNGLHGVDLKDRVYGPSLTLKLCEAAAVDQLPVYFFGSRREVVEALVLNLRKRFPELHVAGYEPSRFRSLSQGEKEELVKRIRESGSAMTFVGLGCPRQEIWAYEFGDDLSMPVIAVGAAFDFHAGLLAQAPPLLQRLGLEWLFRWMAEPKRLWRRYLLLNPRFVGLFTLQKLGWKRFDPSESSRPRREHLFG